MNENKNYKIATVVLSGYGDNEVYVASLMDNLNLFHKKNLHNSKGVYRFPYNYSVKDKYSNKFASFDVLKGRFIKFLKDKGLLESDVLIDFVGYSQGGMIALYSAGRNEKVRNRIRKYVSIASPHGGALRLRGLLFVPIVSLIALGILTKGCTAQLTGTNSWFLSKSYPAAADKVFSVVPKENMLQIWSPFDGVAYPKSSKRFVNNKRMLSYETRGTHLGIPKRSDVINKTIEFLYRDEIEKAKKYSMLSRIVTDRISGLPGDKIRISSPYYGEYTEGCSISVKLGNDPVESRLEDGKRVFEVPDTAPGTKSLGVTFSGIPNHPDIESVPVFFTVQPYLEACSPHRVLIGEKTVIHGEYPLNNEISVHLDGSEVSYRFSENNNGCEITVPKGIPDGKKEIKIRHNGVYSNPIELIACDLIGNCRTRELHFKECPWAGLMKPGNKVYLSSTYDDPKENGFYDSCHWCHVRDPEGMGPSMSNSVQWGRQLKCPHCNKIIDVGAEYDRANDGP